MSLAVVFELGAQDAEIDRSTPIAAEGIENLSGVKYVKNQKRNFLTDSGSAFGPISK
jgi:hypothetical protein